jgi:arsenate reductase
VLCASAAAATVCRRVLRVSTAAERTYNVLFLCTGNSARSIIAEAILNRLGEGRFRAYSAGSYPKGEVHPMAIKLLRDLNFPTDTLRSKSWDEFGKPDSPRMDFIFTVCDNAAEEQCPVWPGQPITAHWGIEDPAAADEKHQAQAFHTALTYLRTRIALFLSLPLRSIDEMATREELRRIGRSVGAISRADA